MAAKRSLAPFAEKTASPWKARRKVGETKGIPCRSSKSAAACGCAVAGLEWHSGSVQALESAMLRWIRPVVPEGPVVTHLRCTLHFHWNGINVQNLHPVPFGRE